MEIEILSMLQKIRTPLLDIFMSNITKLGNAGIVWILLTIVLLLIPKTRKSGLILASALIVDLILCNGILKPLIARIRPFDVNSAIQLIVAKTARLFLPIRSYCRLIYSSNGIVSCRREKTVENSISPCRSYRIFKALFICSLSNRRIRWNHNWSYCRLHRIQTNFYCPVKAQKEAVNGSSRLQLFSSVFLNKKVS